MKMIFESEKEKDDILKTLAGSDMCPSDFGFKDPNVCWSGEISSECIKCWKNCGLEVAVTDKSYVSKLEARLERLREFCFTFSGDDWEEVLHEAYGQCVLTPEDISFLCEIDEGKCEKESIIYREKILEKRCERYREIIRNHVRVEDIADELVKEGKLSPNDARYLFDLEEVNTTKGMNGYPELFTDCDRTVAAKKKPPIGIHTPRYLWERKRCREIAEAIDRYTYAEELIPNEWVEEYNELVEKGGY